MANKLVEEWNKLPTWGKVAIGIGGAGGVYYAYRTHENAKAAAAAASTDSSTGSSSYDSETDPITGLTYGEDISEYGSVQAADDAVQEQDSEEAGLSSADNGAYDVGGGGGYYEDYGYGEDGGTTTGTTSVATNAQWVSEVTAGLEQLGYSASDVTAALGLYLASLPMSSSQAAIISTALAEYGPPPVGSYTVTLSSSSSGTGTATTGNSTGSSTSSTGSSSTGSSTSSTGSSTSSSGSSTSSNSNATPETAPINLRASTSGAVTTISWQAVGAVSGYEYQIAQPSGALYRSGSVTVPSGSFDNLVDIQKGVWHFKCRAFNAAGFGPWSSVLAFTP